MDEQKTVVYMGNKQAGCIGLLTLLTMGYEIKCVVSYGALMSNMAQKFYIPIATSIKEEWVTELLGDIDFLISCHGRQIVPPELLKLPRIACMNIHPCLFKYKGTDPVNRMLEDKGKQASVGVHIMIEEVDMGEVLSEIFVDVAGKQTADEVYNELYPYYTFAIIEALRKL